MKDVDIRYALKAVFRGAGQNYVLDQNVMGIVSVEIKDVTFIDALEAILKAAKTVVPVRYRIEERVHKFEGAPAAPNK